MKMNGLFVTVAIVAATSLMAGCSFFKGKPSDQNNNSAASGTGNSAQARPLPTTNLSREQLRGKTIQLSDQVSFDADRYVELSNFSVVGDTKIVFDPGFQARFLTQPPEYNEYYAEGSDRLIVTRELTLHTKDPCDKDLAEAFTSLCFQSKAGAMPGGLKKGLLQIRRKLERALAEGRPEAQQWREALAMNDNDLVDYLLNQQTKVKTISRTSVVPYVAYTLKGWKHQQVSDLTKPLRQTNTLQAYRPVDVPAAMAVVPPANDNGVMRPAEDLNFPHTTSTSRNIVMGRTLAETFADTYKIRFARETWLTDEYYVKFVYDVTFGLGIRFPFELTTGSEITHVMDRSNQIVPYPTQSLCRQVESSANAEGCATRGSLGVNVRAVPTAESNRAFYQTAGVPRDEIFDGNEFVFQLGASCRFSASIPGPNKGFSCPTAWNSIIDENRNYVAPLGNTRQTLATFVESGRSLGLAYDTGLGYIALNPVLVVKGKDGALDLSFEPTTSGDQANARLSNRRLTLGSTEKDITVTTAVGAGRVEDWGAKVRIDNYTMGIDLEPSVEVEAGIDLGVYEWTGKAGPYTLDALAIDIGDYEFDVHEGVTARQTVTLGRRDNKITPPSPDIFRVLADGTGPDRMVIVENANCQPVRVDSREIHDYDLQYGDALRFTHSPRFNVSETITPRTIEHLGPTVKIRGLLKNHNSCNRGKISVQFSNSCNQGITPRYCDVHLDTNACHALGLENGSTLLDINGNIAWRGAQQNWPAGSDTYCVISQASATVVP
ncbi:hypothetical protein OAV62_00085 [bacterium]|nr:hypothetical protein [bacterium]